MTTVAMPRSLHAAEVGGGEIGHHETNLILTTSRHGDSPNDELPAHATVVSMIRPQE